MSVAEVITYLGIQKGTVHTWITGKAVPAHKAGRLWKFRIDEVDRWVRSGGAAASMEMSNGRS